MADREIGVLGAAMAGSLVALELLRKTEQSPHQSVIVHLIDQNSRILGKKSTSSNQCFRLHTGMHYPNHLETAKKLLLASIEFARQYPDCLFEKENKTYQNPKEKYLNRMPGYFYIISESAVGMDDRIEADGSLTKGARFIAAELNQLYKQMIAIDPQNEVFGPAETFIKEIPLAEAVLAPEEIDYTDQYGHQSKRTLEGAFEVREAQIDIDKFREQIEHALQPFVASGRLKIHTSTKINSVTCDPDSLQYQLSVTDFNQGDNKIIPVNAVVNCTWKDIPEIEQDLFPGMKIFNEHNGMDVRGKISLLVRLPDKNEFDNFTTCLFASGGYCSITMVNYERREAVLTFSPKSDLEKYTAGQKQLPTWVKELDSQQLTPHSEPGKHYADAIMKGCAGFLPQCLREDFLTKTQVLEVRLAHVCAKKSDAENYNMEDPHSHIHKRLESGIEQPLLGFIRYACIKMTYGPVVAKEVAQIVLQHLETLDKIEQNLSHYSTLSPKEKQKLYSTSRTVTFE